MRCTTPLSQFIGHTHPSFPRKEPGEQHPDDNDGLELPVNPDQGTPLIPDEQGDIVVPV